MAISLKTLVIGTSLTEASDAVVRTGVAIARETGASPWLIHVYPPLLGAYGAGVDALWMEEQVERLKEQVEEQAEAAFPPRRVEIPVDLSPISAHGLRQGMALLAQMGTSPAEAEALFVLNPFEVAGSISFTPEQIQRFAKEELQRFAGRDGGRGRQEALGCGLGLCL